jgi:short-subunit dehydrogenase
MRPYQFARGTAILTGAASGIGAALAVQLADRGAPLVLVDRDEERLAAVAGTVRAKYAGLPVTTVVVDLADEQATLALGQQLAADHPDTTLLINNAGVALGGRFDQVTAEEFDWLLAINFRAVVTLTRALYPVLVAHPGSHLVNVSSLFGLIAPAGQVAYATSKYAVRGFTEAMRAELAPLQVGVTVVHPGGIRTRIAENARAGSGVTEHEGKAGRDAFAKLLTFDPEEAAALIVRAVERRRPRLLIGWSAKIPDVLARVAPGNYTKLLGVLQRRGSRNS